MSKPGSPHEKSVKQHAYESLRIIIRLQMLGKRFLSSHMMKHSFHIGTLPRNDVRRTSMQRYDAILTSVKVCSHECFTKGQNKRMSS